MYSTSMDSSSTHSASGNSASAGDAARQPYSSLGELIRRRRLELGLTQKEVEARTGGYLSQNYISQVERGEVERPAFDRLEAFAAILQMPVNDLKIAAGYPVVTVLKGASDAGTVRGTETAKVSVVPSDLQPEEFDPWLKSIGELSPEDFERLKAAVREREEHERRQRRGNDRR